MPSAGRGAAAPDANDAPDDAHAMPSLTPALHVTAVAAQLVVAASVLFVWTMRTANVAREFREYRLPDRVRDTVGASKIALATLLVVGIWYPPPLLAAALAMAGFMGCAQIAHARVRHAWPRFVPSFVLLVLSLFVAGVAYVARGSAA